jgi:hypothetical protein
MRCILLPLAVCAAHAAAAAPSTSDIERPQRVASQGVVALPFQRHFDACTSGVSATPPQVQMHGNGRVLLYVSHGSSAPETHLAVMAFENCLSRYGQQR